jgi:hypothetical protein
MLSGRMNGKLTITTFLIVCACCMLAPGKGMAAPSPSDSVREAKLNTCIHKISMWSKMILQGINRDSLNDMGLEFRGLSTELESCLDEDACTVIDKSRLIDFYIEVLQKSAWSEQKERAVEKVAELGSKCGREQEVLPVIENALNHEYIGVRLSAANGLFDMGFLKEAHQFYMHIITMNPKELRKIIENQPLSNSWKMMLAPDGQKRDSAYYQERDQNLANWKATIILRIVEQLIKYNDPETEESIKKAVTKNVYIKSEISKLVIEHRSTRAHRGRPETFEKLERYINEK